MKENVLKLVERIKEDKNFVEQLNKISNLSEGLEFLKKNGFNLTEEELKRLGTIDWSDFPDKSVLPAEVLDFVVGGSFWSDLWKGFQYGFLHPISSIVGLIKHPEKTVEEAKKTGDFELGDWLVHKFV